MTVVQPRRQVREPRPARADARRMIVKRIVKRVGLVGCAAAFAAAAVATPDPVLNAAAAVAATTAVALAAV